ncbi:MAG: hypothetical protein NTNFB02_02140 [Nitrospira sp.]|jgi:hypothetical protein
MKAETDILTVNIVVRVSPKEKALLEKYAAQEGWSVSEYIRATMITDMAMMHQDVEAMKIVFNKAKQKLAQRFSEKLRPFHTQKPERQERG